MSPKFLDCARSIAEKAGISEQVSFQEGDINNLPFDDATFDWVWSANCAGYAPGEPLPLLKELARVVKPGGSVIILAWSSQQLLPGYPVLEAHLNRTSLGIGPFVEGAAPELHLSRMMGWAMGIMMPDGPPDPDTDELEWTFVQGMIHDDSPVLDSMKEKVAHAIVANQLRSGGWQHQFGTYNAVWAAILIVRFLRRNGFITIV
jgi:SAM-dependent methyltransferase